MSNRSRNLTSPGDLLVVGVIALILGVVARQASGQMDSGGGFFEGLSVVLFVAGALLILGSGLAKVIAIGVRSGRG